MASSVIMPQLGETVAEGKILTWFKSVGDEIKAGEALFEVETDKVTIDVQAIVEGRLAEIRVGAGAVAKVGEVVAVVGGDALATAAAPADPLTREAPLWRLTPFEEVATPVGAFGPAKGPDGIRITPLARRLMSQNGLEVDVVAATVRRSGGDKIDERAVRATLSSAPAAAAAPTVNPTRSPVVAQATPAGPADVDILPLNAIRLKTAERLTENWRTIPHVFQAIEVDFTEIERVRKHCKAAFQATHGFSLTFLPFIARATCLAISAFPQINARLDGARLAISREVNLAIAVDLAHNGLVAPVVRNAADLTLVGLAKALRQQIDKARVGDFGVDDLSGGTYSISNNGAFGTTFTAPIINAPQVAILSTDAIRLKPAIVSTPAGDFVAPRMQGVIGQSFDHRAFDGAYSAAFLSRLKSILEQRNWAEDVEFGS